VVPKIQGGNVPEDLRHYKQDSFALFDSAEAGAILGAIVAGCVIYDLFQRFLSWLG
jgi:hypothetical protein